MSMSMYVYRIRKRFLYTLGVTEEQIKEFGGVLSSWKDQDGISSERTLFCASEHIGEGFSRESDLLNRLESYKDVSKIPRGKHDYIIRIYTLNDLKRLLQDVKDKKVRLHYETEDDFNKNEISIERRIIIEHLEYIVESSYADKYYYTTGWY